MTTVAAVISSYRSAADLPECVRSLRAGTVAPNRIVIVDASPDGESAELGRSLGAEVIELDNRGLGCLYNHGVEHVAARARHWAREGPAQHDLAGFQSLAVRRQLVGQPRDAVGGVVEHSSA